MQAQPRILIVGGGAAGIDVAARLRRAGRRRFDIAVIEPSQMHYYQPLWTLVGAGIIPKQATARPEGSLIPRGVTWIQDRVDYASAGSRIFGIEKYRRTLERLVKERHIQTRWHHDLVEVPPATREAIFQVADAGEQVGRFHRPGREPVECIHRLRPFYHGKRIGRVSLRPRPDAGPF